MIELTYEQWQAANAILARPLTPAHVEFRLANFSDGAPNKTVEVLAYCDASDYIDRLNEALTPGGWDFEPQPTQYAKLDISLGKGKPTIEVPVAGWGVLTLPGGVQKKAYGEASNVEPGKGFVSDLLKMCAKQAGVGTCLYHLPKLYARLGPDKALPHSEVERLRAVVARCWRLDYTPQAPPEMPVEDRRQASYTGSQDNARPQGGAQGGAQGGQQPHRGAPHPAPAPVPSAAFVEAPATPARGVVDEMTPEQRQRIMQGCEALGQPLPQELERFSHTRAASYLQSLEAGWRQRANAQTQQNQQERQPVAQPAQ